MLPFRNIAMAVRDPVAVGVMLVRECDPKLVPFPVDLDCMFLVDQFVLHSSHVFFGDKI
jgi:hypothetical protein